MQRLHRSVLQCWPQREDVHCTVHSLLSCERTHRAGTSQATHEPINTRLLFFGVQPPECCRIMTRMHMPPRRQQHTSSTTYFTAIITLFVTECDCHQRNFWLWVSPVERAMLMRCWCLNFSSQAVLSLEGQDHAWLWEMLTQRLQQALLLLTMNTASHHYSTVLPWAMSWSSPHWQSYGFPSMKDYLQILL